MSNKPTNKWVIGDPHFSHRGVTKFMGPDGVTKLRPWDDVDAMNSALIANWNDTVAPDDVVFVVGDFCVNRSALPIQHALNGKKVLIKGNHDNFRTEEYSGFAEIAGCVVLNGIILTHIPVHPNQLDRFGLNVHGHMHGHMVRLDDGEPDMRYMCVSVEHTQFKPLSLKECFARRDWCYANGILQRNAKGGNM